MSLQEITVRAETEALPSRKKLLQLLKLPALVINQFSISKAAFFSSGLVVSYTFMENTVSSQLMDNLTSSLNNQRIAAIITNLQDGLSCISLVIVYLISEAYTGRFTMIAFCSSASIMGLMLFWISSIRTANLEYDMVYVAIILITLGSPGGSMSEEFLNDQLMCEKVRSKKERKPEHEGTDNARKKDLKTNNEQMQAISLLNLSALLVGYATAVIFAVVDITQHSSIGIGSLIMVGTYLLFYSGYAWYSHENLLAESNIGKIYRICKAAYRKRKFRYPTSENGYYWKHYKQNHFYKVNRPRVIRLLPRVPSLLMWLDKAAIIKQQSADYDLSPQQQEVRGELCTVKEARETKSVALLICWGFTFFACSLVLAAGNTFFIAQAGYLKEVTTNDLSILFILKSIIGDILPIICWLFGILFKRMGMVEVAKNWVTNFGFKRTDATVLKIGIGMVCALICCILAWHVEVQRLYLIKKEGVLQNPDPYANISMSTTALIPQFLFLGVAEWLAADGLKEIFHAYASKTMRTFDESFSQLVIGVGKLFTIPTILIFGCWIQESSDTSRLDKYYLRLAVLNSVFLLLFVLYYFRYAHKKEYPEDEEIVREQTLEDGHHQAEPEGANAAEENLSIGEGPVVSEEDEESGMEQTLEHVHQEDSGEANASEEYFSIGEGSVVSEEGEEIVMEQTLEHAHQAGSKEVNARELILDQRVLEHGFQATSFRTWSSSRHRKSKNAREESRQSA